MKRMICVLLALIMLLGVMPASVSAAGMSVSENAITVLKNLQKYNGNTCIQVGTEFRTGYGTICTTCTKAGSKQTHTYSEKKADADLRAKLSELATAVNGFASSNSVTLNQNKFDALVLLSYDIGTAWLSGSGVLKSAVVNGLTGNAFLNAIGQSSALGSDATDHITGQERRMIEGNMYLNGSYTDVTPKNYSWVNYNANGGTMAEGKDGLYTQYFDANIAAKPAPIPTRKGYTFLGWYMDNGTNTITWVPALAGWQVGGKTLTARWQPEGTAYTACLGTSGETVYNWLAPSFIASKDIYDKPNGTVTDTHTSDRVMIDRDWIDTNGNRWGHLLSGGNGWVLVSGSSSSSKFDVDVTVTVTNSTLNGRANSNAASKLIKTFSKGDQLRIISTETTAYKLWGQVADENGTPICWVCLMYTNWNEVKDKAPTDSNNSSNTEAIAKAVVNCEGYLNVRSAAGTDSAIVGALADGDHVDIYEIEFVNGHQWGRTTGGWILLTYAKVEMVEGNNASFTNTKDVLAYTFTGKLNKNVTAHTSVAHSSELVGKELKSGTTVAVSMIKNGEGGVWGFNGVGWIQLKDIEMEVAKYVVVADGLTVRDNYANDATQIEKVSKGGELNITDLAVVDATIWGYTEKFGGWVNLASKFVKRSNAPVIENVSGNVESNWVATVVNTDSVNVRVTDTATSKRIGGLGRGVTVRVWDNNGEGGEPTWYKVDSNQNGIYEEDSDGWVAAQYLSIEWMPLGEEEEENEESSGSSSTSAAIETGLGIVANTYSGVNIRSGAGTGYAANGKYLNGTAIEILEVTSTATAKWGRTEKGWVCMDYVNMVNKYPIGGTAVEETKPTGPNAGGSTTTTEGNTTFTSTPASYTGKITTAEVELKKTADVDAITPNTLSAGSNVTIQELRKVTTKTTASNGEVIDGNASTENVTITTSTTYWARTNGGWIENPGMHIALNALEETVYTNVGESDVDVFSDANGSRVTSIPKNVQVTITSVKIAEDKVWGFAEDIGTAGGWVRLDRLAQGAHKATETNTNNNNNNSTNNSGASSSGNNFTLGAGGDTAGAVPTGGYRYTGKVINTNQVRVRSIASTSGTVTTTLKGGAALVIYETTICPEDLSAWGRCDAGWVHLYYVDLVPATSDGAVDARVVQTPNTVYYTDSNMSSAAGTYAKGSVIDIYEIVGTMARTKLGWVSINDLLN